MSKVTQVFQSAPMGKRVIFQMIFGIGAVCVAFTVGTLVAFEGQVRHHHEKDWIAAFIAPAIGIVVGVPAFFAERARVAAFRIEENVLVLGKQQYPLEGLVSVDRDPDVLRGARRCLAFGFPGFKAMEFGKRNVSGKLASIQGTFKSKKLGRFYAFLTGTENAVVVRWPDKAVTVSPADPEFFIYMVRQGAGLR
jgi:hypothetical protein